MAGKEVDVTKQNADLLLGEVPINVESSESMTRSIIERNLKAETVDDVFNEQVTIACKDFVGNPIRVTDVRLAEGAIDGQATTYMLIDAVDMNTGETLILNTGAPQITSKLFNLKLKDALPIEVYIVEAAAARQGRNAVLSIRRVADGHSLPH
jgi:hypothetical protein